MDLLRGLAESDMRVRYGRGPWQFIKWLIDPFALAGVYLALIALVLDRPGDVPGLSVACAIVPFQLVMTTVITSLDSIRTRSTIIGNMKFPREFVPVAACVTESVAFVSSFALLAMMMAIYGVAPTGAVIWLPLVVLATLALAASLSYPAALFQLWLPDLRAFAVSFMRTSFFLAPGLIALEDVYGYTHDVLKINPLTGLFEGFRAVLIEGHAPAFWMVAYPIAFAGLIALVFVPIYRREQGHLAKLID